MSTSKRRKIEAPDGSQPMTAASAFALRRQLLSSPGASSPSVPATEISQTPEDAPMSPGPATAPPSKGSRSPRKKLNDKPAVSVIQDDSLQLQTTEEGSKPAKGDAQGTDDIQEPTYPAPVKQFSTFRLTKQNSRRSAKGVLQLKLSESERFLVLGSFGVRLVSGEVTLCGASIRPSDPIAWVHAPLCHAVPVLRCSEDAKLELHPHPHSSALRGLERLSPLFRGLWNEPSNSGSKPGSDSDTFQIVYTSNDVPRKAVIQDLVSHPAWNKKLAELVAGGTDKPPVVFLCGPKGSGKSTFGRILTNKLLTSPFHRSKRRPPAVAVLDLDPGQPEYSPAGTIALVHVKAPNLSPPFAHALPDDAAASVIRLHATASVSPASDPELFTRAALDLYHRYRQSSSLRSRPLVINTPGWILGTGLDLLTELVTAIRPTNVIYMSEDGPAESVEALKAVAPAPGPPASQPTPPSLSSSKPPTSTFATLPSQQSDFASRTAAHLRAMQAMSYFHSVPPESDARQAGWYASPLTARPPVQVGYVGPDAGILGILSYEFQPPANLLSETINGSVLAIVEAEDAQAFDGLAEAAGGGYETGESGGAELDGNGNVDDLQKSRELRRLVSRSPEGIPFLPNPDSRTLDPRHCRALGLALLRGIDTERGILQMLTPVAVEKIRESRELGRALVLVHGRFDTPAWAYTEDAYARTWRGDGGPGGRDAGGSDDEKDGVEEEDDQDVGDAEGRSGDGRDAMPDAPWVEVLKGNEKRPVGSRVWRVRRDLGKGGPGGD